MAHHRWIVALALTGCEDSDAFRTPPACEGDVAVQLIAIPAAQSAAGLARGFAVQPVRDGTVLYMPQQGAASTQLGRGCGVDAVPVGDGASLHVARTRLDPTDDDPRLACLNRDDLLVELDIGGTAPAKLLLPQLSCSSLIPTAHGVLASPPRTGISPSIWWHLPHFPSDEGITVVPAVNFASPPQVVGDTAYFLDLGLNAYDLAARKSTPLLAGVEEFAASDTHLLLRGTTEGTTAPMYLFELATHALVRLGDFDGMVDNAGLGGASWQFPSWSFDRKNRRVLHIPADPSGAGEVFDLAGARAVLPLAGRLQDTLSDGTVIAYDVDLELLAARPGDPVATRLDAPTPGVNGLLFTSSVTIHDDRLEASIAGALHEIPLDGGPPRMLFDGVGEQWTWIDDRLVTIFEGKLTVIDTSTGERTVHSDHAVTRTPAPDGLGVYYLVAGPDGDPDNGVWYLPATAL